MEAKNYLKNLTTALILMLMVSGASAQSANATPNELFKLGFSAFQQGNYDLALRNYNLAIGMDPARNYFYYNRGLAYKALGNNDNAIKDFKLANEFKPTAEAFYQVGLIKYQTGDLEGARNEFESAKLIREDLENMNFYLGMIYFRNNRYEEATKCFYDFTNHVKTNADAYYYRGLSEAKSHAGLFAENYCGLRHHRRRWADPRKKEIQAPRRTFPSRHRAVRRWNFICGHRTLVAW